MGQRYITLDISSKYLFEKFVYAALNAPGLVVAKVALPLLFRGVYGYAAALIGLEAAAHRSPFFNGSVFLAPDIVGLVCRPSPKGRTLVFSKSLCHWVNLNYVFSEFVVLLF